MIQEIDKNIFQTYPKASSFALGILITVIATLFSLSSRINLFPGVAAILVVILIYAISIKKLKIFFFGLLGAVTPYALFFGFLMLAPVYSDYSSRINFDSKIWKDSTSDKKAIRINMVNNLLNKHKLIGMKKDEIDSLIGVPPKTEYFKEYQYVYWLGPERGFISIDSEWLGIKFRDGIVINADVLRD